MTRRPAPPRRRCPWAGVDDPLYLGYHDREWGRPVRDDRVLFEFLVLEGAQAGLSWITVLRKREAYRKAMHRFDWRKLARCGARDVARWMRDPGLVRNRLKLESVISNARAFAAVRREHGSFARWLWAFVGGRPVVTRRRTQRAVPATTPLSDAIAKELKSRGFRFVGSTIVYAYLQAVGVVDDHVDGCFRARAPSPPPGERSGVRGPLSARRSSRRRRRP
jgi:DNA-3-methyladenine glycosylase I